MDDIDLINSRHESPDNETLKSCFNCSMLNKNENRELME
jgi:hypothetical protein